MSLTFAEALTELRSSPTLTSEFAARSFASIFGGEWNPTQVAGFVIGLGVRGLTPEILAGAAGEMRARMIRVPGLRRGLVDTCGTGGDGSRSLNLSTGAAFVLAALGSKVAKHGNRAASSQSGSADVLEKLGVRLDLSPEAEGEILDRIGIVFLFAQMHHPALRHVGGVRRELGVRTIFNCLGPLANPASAEFQLVGAYSDALRPLLASALGELGVRRAWVVRGADGMDEISPFGPTFITAIEGNTLREFTVSPADFGFEPSAPGAVNGGTPEENARDLERILRGEPHPGRTALLLNAAGALVVERELEWIEAARLAQSALDSGAAFHKLVELRELSQARADR